VAQAVKQYAREHPHSMGEWSADSKTRVLSMPGGDFYGTEQSALIQQAGSVRIEHIHEDGQITVLKESVAVLENEIIDAAVLNCAALRDYYREGIEQARQDRVLLSLHLKATMMKIYDPIMFGHAVAIYYQSVFEQHADTFDKLGIDPRNGINDVYHKLTDLPGPERTTIEEDIAAVYARGPQLAMVDSERGITNLHVPSHVIVDASMPAMIRAGGKMWGPDGRLHDTLAMIPDRNYAGVYQATIDFCKQHGAFDVTTMGNVSNVGLMAQKAEEYGSHDKTFEIPSPGRVRVVDESGNTLLEHPVERGDIWRMCQTKDLPVQDWVKLAVRRARTTGQPAIFWLDQQRPHDARLIAKVRQYLQDHDTSGLDIQIMSPVDATDYTLERLREGKDTISVTGNVLRDYLTDLFPILELGTSAKMLSIVPLLSGGGLFETGAGGTAPLLYQQFLREGHLGWDSLGEFLALAVSLEDLAQKTGNTKAGVLAKTLDEANSQYLHQNRAPAQNPGEIDSRGSHFYLALNWAQALAIQDQHRELQARFLPLAEQLSASETEIVDGLLAAQGQPVELKGYYHPDRQLTEKAMRPSSVFNTLLASL